MNIVLDSSVIAKWFFEEENREKAIHLRQLHKQTDIAIKVPSLLLFELGNIFLNKKAFNKQFFNESISTLFSINLQFVAGTPEIGIIKSKAMPTTQSIKPLPQEQEIWFERSRSKRLLPNIPRRRRQPAIQGRATRFPDPTFDGCDVSQRGLVKGTRL